IPIIIEKVSVPLTRIWPNSLALAASASMCKGWVLWVRVEKRRLSVSVIVRRTSWAILSPTTHSPNHLPAICSVLQGQLHADMAADEAKPFVKTMRVGPVGLRGELDHPAIAFTRAFDRPSDQLRTDPLPAKVRGDAHRLD